MRGRLAGGILGHWIRADQREAGSTSTRHGRQIQRELAAPSGSGRLESGASERPPSTPDGTHERLTLVRNDTLAPLSSVCASCHLPVLDTQYSSHAAHYQSFT